MNRNFLVYKSSAGSGKTTTLVKEYLKICLKNPGAFRHVLAITFTNKAANEMKSKILSSLKDFSRGALSHPLSKEISSETGLDPKQLQRNASRLLSLIIHYYDEFSVSTIDSFVHQIVRTFATDLHLPQAFEVIIDKDDLVPFILDDLYNKMGKEGALTQILIRFVLSQVEDEKTYQLDHFLSGFIEKQLDEEGYTEAKVLQKINPADFLNIIEQLRKGISQSKKRVQQQAEEALMLIREAHLEFTDFFHGKLGVAGYFEKLRGWRYKIKELFPNSYVNKAIDEDLWYSKGKPQPVKDQIDTLAPVLRKHLITIIDELKSYAAYVLVYRNIYQAALIREIRQLLDQFTLKTGAVHISEFNKRIFEEISDQPIPFIYERIGRRYRHFLIDEFQDTSVLQWNNLLPLVEESLAGGHFNMIVGDAKQAIYRFRNGEVELFTHLPKLYGHKDTPENRIRQQAIENNYIEKRLKVNYRSRERIIDFNNRFFEQASQSLDDHFRGVYKDHFQETPRQIKTEGLVQIDFIHSTGKTEYSEQKKQKIVTWVSHLQEKGYPLREICVLTRTNEAGAEIAAHLLGKGFPVVSSDSLKLNISVEVRLVVGLLRCLLEPGNQLYQLEFLSRYHEFHQLDKNINDLFTEFIHTDKALARFFRHYEPDFPNLETLQTRTVFEISEEIIRHLVRPKQPNIFLQYFLDFVFDKQVVYEGSLAGFLKLWDEKKDKLNILMPEGLDAIQVMTAHKAKGLKFGVVIVDLAKDNKPNTRNFFWDQVPEVQVKELPIALLRMNADLEFIGKKQVLDYETAKTKLDFLNLIYVAFTRPVDGLYVLGNIKNDKPDLFSAYLKDFLVSQKLWNNNQESYCFGRFPDHYQPEKTESTDAITLTEYPTVAWYKHLVVAPEEDIYWEAIGQQSSRTYGNIIHHILSKIDWAGQAEQKIAAMHNAGILDVDETKKVQQLLDNFFANRDIAPYFQKGILIKKETELYNRQKGHFVRPDRVVLINEKLCIIDYKTGEAHKSHQQQLDQYAEIYARLGYQSIEKVLIYLSPQIHVLRF